MKPQRGRRAGFATLVLPWALVASATTLPAAAAEPQAGDQAGLKCTAPVFSFKWYDYRLPMLVVKADPAGWFRLRIKAVGADTGPLPHYPMLGEKPLHVQATSAGTTVPVDLSAFDLYQRNFVQVEFDGGVDRAGADAPVCDERRGVSEPILAFEKHILRIDAGSGYVLEKGGDFATEPEIAVSATSKWSRVITGVVDLRFASIGKLAEEPAMESDMGGDGDGDDEPGEMDDTEDAVFNPFTTGGNVVRGSFYMALHPWNRLRAREGADRGGRHTSAVGILLGGGFTTVPGDEGDFLDARLRVVTGVRFQVLGYNQGKPGDSLADTVGFVQLGAAYDRFWEFDEVIPATTADGMSSTRRREEFERVFVESGLEIPNVGTQGLRVAVRMLADIPASGDGPSEVRVSALLSIDPKGLGKLLGVGSE